MAKSQDNKNSRGRGKKCMLVRHGLMGNLGLFEHNENKIPKVHTRVVVKTDKGLEMGCIVGGLTCYRGGQYRWNQSQLREYFENSDMDLSSRVRGKFVRYATSEDISEERHLRMIAKDEIECCRRFVKELDLPMKIVAAEHIFGGERVIFYFMADGRVDFRELVRRIAHEYQTRIEMRQIGARDEAKLLGDVESCGQPCCCQRFLKLLKPVNMRMAKMQKATLDPSKISGYCGRLKCCLRYEDKNYTQLKKRLPRKNTRVKTEKGEGRVVDSQILTQLVVVQFEGGEKAAFNIDEVEILSGSSQGRPRKSETPRQTADKPASDSQDKPKDDAEPEKDSETKNEKESEGKPDQAGGSEDKPAESDAEQNKPRKHHGGARRNSKRSGRSRRRRDAKKGRRRDNRNRGGSKNK